MSSLNAFLLLLLLALLSLLFIIKRRNGRVRRNLPPGPAYWPLLGNVSLNNTQKIHTTINDLEAKYGPIFTLMRGEKPFIIVTSAELIREALVEKGQIFCSRPHSAGHPTIGSTPQGALWRALRKNFATQMLNPAAKVNALRSFRRRAMQALLDRLSTESAKNGGVVGVEEDIRFAVFGIMLFMCFGFDMDVGFVREFQSAMADVLREAKILSTGYAAFPLGSFFQQYAKAKEVKQILSRGDGLLVSLVEKRRQTLREGQGSAYVAYVDTLFDMELSDAEVVGLCAEFVHAGSLTTCIALQFLVGNLANYPHVQAKVHEDVVSVVGERERAAEVEDVEKMEYVEAVVMETLRRHIPSYFTLPYTAMQDCTLGGWHVPAGAAVNLYQEGMTKDPRLWEKPWDFVPERFMNARVDVTGTKDMKMIPFGTGRRMCPGSELAMTHLRLIAVRLVQGFQWQCIDDDQPVDLSEMDGFLEVMASPVRSLRKPLKLVAVPRL